ncbi:MAG TPA: NAD-dependent epimerase/dehydratase family protein [Gemmataceae bacterium]|jgi:nucleoside-diphosphate-sugar epimerase|nr:NAD-dependent epimerase/dehydratase family protein [Gemmataceae bacterium]
MLTLVTGAGGFVGSQVVQECLASAQPVRALLRDPDKAGGLRARGVEVLAGDIRDAGAVTAAMRGVDVVYHCAAAVGPQYSRGEIYETNLLGVRRVLEALRQVGRGKLVLLSSINVLGTRHLDHATEDLPCRRSGDPAADVKIEAERMALEYQRRHGVTLTILRPGFIYGPGDTRNLPKLVEAVRRGRFAYIGSRHHVVPIVHVQDVVRAMLLAAGAAASDGRIYHITDGSRTTIGELVDLLADLVGCPRPRRVLPYWVPRAACTVSEWLGRMHLRRGPARITRASLRFLGTSRSVDIGRATEELGYHPGVSYREGVAATLQSLKEQARGQADVALYPT